VSELDDTVARAGQAIAEAIREAMETLADAYQQAGQAFLDCAKAINASRDPEAPRPPNRTATRTQTWPPLEDLAAIETPQNCRCHPIPVAEAPAKPLTPTAARRKANQTVLMDALRKSHPLKASTWLALVQHDLDVPRVPPVKQFSLRFIRPLIDLGLVTQIGHRAGARYIPADVVAGGGLVDRALAATATIAEAEAPERSPSATTRTGAPVNLWANKTAEERAASMAAWISREYFPQPSATGYTASQIAGRLERLGLYGPVSVLEVDAALRAMVDAGQIDVLDHDGPTTYGRPEPSTLRPEQTLAKLKASLLEFAFKDPLEVTGIRIDAVAEEVAGVTDGGMIDRALRELVAEKRITVRTVGQQRRYRRHA
jgi:hypothetical protein